jgi:nucleotidyltransferase/DNA polymerase involved in DNA repair
VIEIFKRSASQLEKASIDEAYLDISEEVEKRMGGTSFLFRIDSHSVGNLPKLEGILIGDINLNKDSDRRLVIGTLLRKSKVCEGSVYAKEIREKLREVMINLKDIYFFRNLVILVRLESPIISCSQK